MAACFKNVESRGRVQGGKHAQLNGADRRATVISGVFEWYTADELNFRAIQTNQKSAVWRSSGIWLNGHAAMSNARPVISSSC